MEDIVDKVKKIEIDRKGKGKIREQKADLLLRRAQNKRAVLLAGELKRKLNNNVWYGKEAEKKALITIFAEKLATISPDKGFILWVDVPDIGFFDVSVVQNINKSRHKAGFLSAPLESLKEFDYLPNVILIVKTQIRRRGYRTVQENIMYSKFYVQRDTNAV